VDQAEQRWPERAWILAAVGAAAGLGVHLAINGASSNAAHWANATFFLVAGIAFILTAERVRIGWAVGFALGAGAIATGIGWFTARYNSTPSLFEWPFLSAILAILIAAPLFQTIRDEGRRSLPYGRVHRYAWTDAIIGGASIAFTGLTFLMLTLLGELFHAIGVDLLQSLLREEWFDWMLAGAAFGTAAAILRERDELLGTLQKLVMAVFSILAPVLAAAILLFLIAVPLTGFAGLWRSGLPETPLLLSMAAFAFVLLNAIVGDSREDRKEGLVWRFAEYGLLFAVLPLGVLALVSMLMRVGQYGWTPDRLWGVLAALVAWTYGLLQWWSWWRGKGDFDGPLRESQKRLAIGLCALALFLSLPIVDFGAISVQSQLSRLQAGKIAPDKFDWAALKFDFGPAGRKALAYYAKEGEGVAKKLANQTQKLESRYDIDRVTDVEQRADRLKSTVLVASPDIVLTDTLRHNIANMVDCGAYVGCKLFRLDDHRLILLKAGGVPPSLERMIIDERERKGVAEPTYPQPEVKDRDVSKVQIEIRDVPTRQVFVNGQAVGPPFE
jgi:hypothetical protein